MTDKKPYNWMEDLERQLKSELQPEPEKKIDVELIVFILAVAFVAVLGFAYWAFFIR